MQKNMKNIKYKNIEANKQTNDIQARKHKRAKTKGPNPTQEKKKLKN